MSKFNEATEKLVEGYEKKRSGNQSAYRKYCFWKPMVV